MKKQVFAIVFAVLLIAIVFSGCFEDNKENNQGDLNGFIGTWKVESPKFSSSTEMKWTFYGNGTVKMVTYSLYSWGPSINVSSDDEQKTLTITDVGQNYSYENIPIVIPYDDMISLHGVAPESLPSTTMYWPWQNNDYIYTEWATYKTKDGKLYVEPESYQSSTSSYFLYPCGAEYEFSNDDNRITLALIEYPVRLTKTSDSNILMWEDVNISVSGAYNVHCDWIKLARSSIFYSGSHAPSEWGYVKIDDVIQFGKYNSSISVTLSWQPSGKRLGTWYFTKIPETLYVGGVGSRNYTKIQDAIDNASDGDTIFVYNGIYYENIIIDKSIIVNGENKNDTILDGESKGFDVVDITTDDVIIKDFTVKNSGECWPDNEGAAGIEIETGIKSNKITDCIVHDCEYSIQLCNNANENIIENCEIYNSSMGISFRSYCSQNNILNTTIYNIKNSYGIILYGPDNNYNLIKNCNSSNNNGNGITLEGSYNIIENCEFSNNIWGGICFFESRNNTISISNIVNNKGNGIFLQDSSNNTIYSNTISNNNQNGIRLIGFSNNVISDNIIKNNWYKGLEISFSSNNAISGNTIENQIYDGILFSNCNNSVISGNTISNNNQNGIIYDSSSNNTIYDNAIDNNHYGIFFEDSSSTNTIFHNTISNNVLDGIIFYYSCNENIIYYNNLINNAQQNARDAGNNTWYNKTLDEGNYWDDYNGADADNDSIGDTPYNITDFDGDAQNQDLYPLMKQLMYN